ncbi:MAG: phosphoribosylaminoimidazolecarboxamide formyltransferase/IMP cyclohydrolase [Myxococcota bacterium]
MPNALISVSDKTGVVAFATALVSAGFQLLSTGGTARALRDGGLDVIEVQDFTGAPERMNGRVKTLHPRVHAAILGDRVRHAQEAADADIPWIDLVVVNLYPFEQTVASGANADTIVENIDIGGPTMLRAAAKNHRYVSVVVDPDDYDSVAAAMLNDTLGQELRRDLAAKAFRHTARYDALIADHFTDAALPETRSIPLQKVQDCRYGENPHQAAAFYADATRTGRSLARLVQHQGKTLSFNNLADLDGAVRAVFEHEDAACVVVKHMNPCGAAVASTPAAAFTTALAGDPTSAYGGIVAFNRPVDVDTVIAIRKSRTFFEVVAAPGFSPEALEKLSGREKLRVIELPADWAESRPSGHDARRVQGGWLLQDWDVGAVPEWTVVTERAPTEQEERALRFAWANVRSVKSNAIVLAASDGEHAWLNGVGAGQMSRVDAVNFAVQKATGPTLGTALASDAFFPFADGVERAAQAGVKAIVQPGGSIRDADVIAAANAAGIAMVFTGMRHFRH